MNSASHIHMSPTVRNTSFPERSFSLAGSNQLFFQTAFSHVL